MFDEGGQGLIVKGDEADFVKSPFCDVSVVDAVPEAGAQVAVNTESGPPLSVTWRSVNGRSGTPLNVVEPVARLTEPVSVIGNGDGNLIVIPGAANEPVR